MSRIQFRHNYHHIISHENLLEAWKEFVCGKRSRKDAQEFERNLMANIISLHRDLVAKTYTHSAYQAFKISDPKPRDIHKAIVRDRLLHHAVYRILYPFFDRIFIADSYSCRIGRGTHKALRRFCAFAYKTSKNDTRTCWVLKCDIRKFFASIDQDVLLDILRESIFDVDILWLLKGVIRSFCSGVSGKGLPLGNLTSQLFANIYMNEFDQWAKHRLKANCYIRYADDFVFFSSDRKELENFIPLIRAFLRDRLKLDLHPKKVSIQTLASGVDFLGWVHFFDHRVLRTTTKKRMFKNIKIKEYKIETAQSYLGLVRHGNGWKLQQKIRNQLNFYNNR